MRKVLTQENVEGLREAIEKGHGAFSGALIYKRICLDHRPAHCILSALEAREQEIVVEYEEWECG